MIAPEPHRLKHGNFLSRLLEKPERGAEIGVERGIFTEQMLLAFPDLHLYAVDIWAAREPLERDGFLTYEDWPLDEIKAEFDGRARRFAGRLTVLHMESLAAADRVPDASLDFVFIDAEHTYEGVARDIEGWRPKVKQGGYLTGHDFSPKYPGVARAVKEAYPDARVDLHSSVWWVRL